MYLGLFGTYRKHETIDVEYRLGGQVKLVSDAESRTTASRSPGRARRARRRARGAARALPSSWAPTRGALEQEVDVVLPGEADPAEGLDRVVGDARGGVGGARLRHRGGERQRLGLGVGAPRPRSRSASAPPRRPRACRRAGARPPGRRRSGGRTARAPWRTRPPCRAPAGRPRPARRRARRRPASTAGATSPGSGSPPSALTAVVGASRVDQVEALERRVVGLDQLRAVAVGEHEHRGALGGADDRLRVGGERGRPARLAGGDAGQPALALLVRARALDRRPGDTRWRSTATGRSA